MKLTGYHILGLREGRTGEIIEYYDFGNYPNLGAAAMARKMSGDLIFEDGKIVDDECWLFGWEKNDPSSYARRKIREKVRIL